MSSFQGRLVQKRRNTITPNRLQIHKQIKETNTEPGDLQTTVILPSWQITGRISAALSRVPGISNLVSAGMLLLLVIAGGCSLHRWLM